MLKHLNKRDETQREVNELVDLCNTWLCLLLRRLGEGEHRFSMQEFKEGLGRLSLNVRRENGDYILCLAHPSKDKEEQHDGNQE